MLKKERKKNSVRELELVSSDGKAIGEATSESEAFDFHNSWDLYTCDYLLCTRHCSKVCFVPFNLITPISEVGMNNSYLIT